MDLFVRTIGQGSAKHVVTSNIEYITDASTLNLCTFKLDSFPTFLADNYATWTVCIFVHLISEYGRSPLFEEYIGSLLVVLVSLCNSIYTPQVSYREDGDGLSFTVKIFSSS
jgi:hypothetical protein